ncbi:DUF2625 family protein [Celerinatantimonas sp. MCCC 1A17872]|uniref:DUF2625 family protein n=1 Tax=Celerinatantimonas sp. MCCC 1A17872 TaxID=3177514 RepID=UPI0038C0D251
MKSLEQLIDSENDAILDIRAAISQAQHSAILLERNENSGTLLKALQLSTHSTLGALIYHTGGVLVANGWLRFLASGNEQLERDIVSWNQHSDGYLLVGDDAVGGFFAINGGALGTDVGCLYYLSPDETQWEDLEVGFSDFFSWSLTTNLEQFYADLGKSELQQQFKVIPSNQCIDFYPPLYSREGSVQTSSKQLVSVSERLKQKLALTQK